MMFFDGLDVDRAAPRARVREDADGDWRLVPTWANRMPTAASYLRQPGDSEFRAFKFDVLRIEDGASPRSRRSARAVPGVRPAANAMRFVAPRGRVQGLNQARGLID